MNVPDDLDDPPEAESDEDPVAVLDEPQPASSIVSAAAAAVIVIIVVFESFLEVNARIVSSSLCCDLAA